METLSKKQQFLQNPFIDPENGNVLKINSKRYKELINKYGQPKVKSPKSHKLISVGKGEYKNLIKEGYTHEQLLSNVKTYTINNKTYTEVQLIQYIQFYDNVNKTDHIDRKVELTGDVLYEIMLHGDIQIIHQYCLTNKNAQQLCHDRNFWINKFTYDQLPLLYQINKENVLKSTKEYLDEGYIENEPDTWKGWETLYKNTVLFMNVATTFVNNIIRTGIFTSFHTPEVKYYEYLWLPVEWFKQLAKLEKMEKKGVYVTVDVNYEIILGKDIQYKIYFYINDIDTGKNYKTFELNLSKKDFIIQLARLFYYQRNFDPDELFLMNEDEDNPEAIMIQDLITNDLKNLFPK